ncbi:MAG: glycosyltransferase family 39 protein [Dehalococcoidia bacterium]
MAGIRTVSARLTRGAAALNSISRSLTDAPIPSSFWLLLLAAVVTGAVLRLWDITGVPPGLQQDEAVYGVDAFSIFKTGRDHLGHPFPFVSLENFGDWSSPLLTFICVPFVGIFGLNVEVIRVVTAMMGLLAIPAVFGLAVLLFQRPAAGVVAAWLIALSPFHVHLSRWAVIPSLVPTMVALTLLVFIWAMRNRNERAFVLAAFIACLTMATYHSMKLYVPLALLPAFLIYHRTILVLKLEALLYAALVFAALAGPIMWLTLRDPAGGARFAQTSVFEQADGHIGTVIEQYASFFSPGFWLTRGSNDLMQVPSGGVELWFVVPLILVGLGWLALHIVRSTDTWLRSSALLIFALVVLYPVPGSLTVPAPDALRGAHVITLAALLGSAGAVALYEFLSALLASRERNFRLGAGALVVAVFALGLGYDLQHRFVHYFGAYSEEVESNFHYGLKDALDYAFQHEDAYDEVWVLPDVHNPYIYVLFYKRWSPDDVHSNLVLTRDPPEWNVVHSIGKYRFDEPTGFSLRDLTPVTSSRYSDGRPAYDVLEGTVNSKRLLVVHRSP